MIKRIQELEGVDFERWDQSLPRYTSYPTAPHFQPLGEELLSRAIQCLIESDRPLSLYMHIPFCRSMCLFCGCAVLLNRRSDRQTEYVERLIQEISLWRRSLGCRKVVEIHWGGGTPTSLNEGEFERLFRSLQSAFIVAEAAEISMEIDPRTVFEDRGKKLAFLKRLGVTRVSFGVQDLDPAVQEAVRRRQTEEMTRATYTWAREVGFQGINMDLIYGLPLQTEESFTRTIIAISELRPDRIALFSYAHVPWMKAHQKAIPEGSLPSGGKKWAIYLAARRVLVEAGYIPIGMDHFALPHDTLTRAYQEQTMVRNFQGYAPQYARDLLGLGITSIGELSDCYLQNVKTLEEYYALLQQERLPVARGLQLSPEDLRQRFAIQALMCQFALHKREFESRFGVPFDLYFAPEAEELVLLEREGLLIQDEESIRATDVGRILIRRVAAVFDRYLASSPARYSKL